MSEQNKSDGTGFALTIVFTLVFLAVALVLSMAMLSSKKRMAKPATAAAPIEQVEPANPVVMLSELSGGAAVAAPNAPESSPANTADAPDVSSVQIDNGKAVFYFATGQSAVEVTSKEPVAAFVATLPVDKKVIVSGYVDSTGDAAINAEISQKRAFAVRDALVAAGVSADRIQLRKPADIQAGTGAQARRVEVSVE